MLHEFMQIARQEYSREMMDSQVRMGIAKGKLQQAAELLPFGDEQNKVLEVIESITELMAKQAQIINAQKHE